MMQMYIMLPSGTVCAYTAQTVPLPIVLEYIHCRTDKLSENTEKDKEYKIYNYLII